MLERFEKMGKNQNHFFYIFKIKETTYYLLLTKINYYFVNSSVKL